MTPTSQPRPLGLTYVKNGFTYEQVARDGNVAIFKQRLRPGVGCLAYETILIQVKPEVVIMGKLTPEREVAPANEEWGTFGWTYPTLDGARAKMKSLLESKRGVPAGVSKV